MKRLLLPACFFPPLGGGGCQRSLKLVRYLEPNGWASTVATVQDPNYWIVDPTLLEEVPRSCDVRALRRLQQLVAIHGWGVSPTRPRQRGTTAATARSRRRSCVRPTRRWRPW